MRTHLALILIMLSAAVVRADGGVGVVVTGDATIQPQLAAKIEGWLRAQGHQLVPSPVPAEELNSLIDCLVIEDLACARTVVEKHATAEMVVFAKVETNDTDTGKRDLTLTVHWFDRGQETVTDRRTCSDCTDAALRTTAELMMATLAGKGGKDVGTVQLTSSPTGARVLIDGKAVGKTPLTYAVAPGEHTITIVHDKHRENTRRVTIRKAESTTVDVRLEPKRSSRALPIAVIAGGGVLLAGGVIAYATSEEDTGETYEYRDTRLLGVGLGIAGAAAIGIGAYLYLRGESAESAPSVAVLPGGAVVGWARTF